MPKGSDYYVAILDRAMSTAEANELMKLTKWNVTSLKDDREVRLSTNLPEFTSFPDNVEEILKKLAEKHSFTIISFATGNYPKEPIQAV